MPRPPRLGIGKMHRPEGIHAVVYLNIHAAPDVASVVKSNPHGGTLPRTVWFITFFCGWYVKRKPFGNTPATVAISGENNTWPSWHLSTKLSGIFHMFRISNSSASFFTSCHCVTTCVQYFLYCFLFNVFLLPAFAKWAAELRSAKNIFLVTGLCFVTEL